MRGIAVWTTALALAFAAAAPAGAKQRLVSWKASSRHVDPDDPQVRFNGDLSSLRVNVVLPDGYDGEKRFPVLYLLHGFGDNYEDWADPGKGNVLEVAKDFPGIIVMPEADRGVYANWWNGGERRSPAWERYHLDQLIPLVERRLKVRRDRRWHAIFGFSMGGEGTMFYASQRPGYFGTAASSQGILSIQRPEWPAALNTEVRDHQEVFGDPNAQRFYWTGHNPTALVENLRHTRLFASVGDGVPTPSSPEEVANVRAQLAEAYLRQHNEDFVDAAEDAGIDVEYQPRQGIHDWPYRRQHLAAAIRWGLFERVPEDPDSWTYITVARRGEMWGLRFRFKEPPDTVQTFTREGRKLSATGEGKVVIRSRTGAVLKERLPFSLRLPRGFFG